MAIAVHDSGGRRAGREGGDAKCEVPGVGARCESDSAARGAVKKRDGLLVAFEAFDPPEEVRDPLGEDDFNVAFGVEAPDSAHAVAFPLFVDLADLENNGRVREDIVLGSGWAGDGFAAPRIWAGLSHL
jgi:hypothetical protein